MKHITKKLTFLSCIFAVALLASCKQAATKGDGNVIKQEYNIGLYDQIKVEGAIDIIYQCKSDETPFLEVEADDNIIPLIDIEVKGKTLHVKSRESINPSRFIVYTNSPSLKYIESKGASNISLDGTIVGDEIKVEMKGVGNLSAANLNYQKAEFKLLGAADIDLAGQIVKAKYEISGTGDINASELIVNELECILKGAGNMKVNAVDKMKIEIKGSGNISYKGNPQITKQEIKGAGTVTAL